MLFNEKEVNQNELDSVLAGIPTDEESIESNHLEKVFFARFPHEIFKAPSIDEKESSLANVYYWSGKYWALINSFELKGFLHRILKEDLHISATCRKTNLIDVFLSKFKIDEEELNVDGKSLFNTQAGVISLPLLKSIMIEKGNNLSVKDLLDSKDEWLFDHEVYKENHLTCIAEISIPDNYDEENYLHEWMFFEKTFLKSLGNRKESLEWFLNLLSSCLSGVRKGEHFTALYGAPGAGKSTLVKFLQKIFGNYISTIEPDDLIQKTSSGLKKFYQSRFSRIISLSEFNDRRIPASFIKKLTGDSEFLVGNQGVTFRLDSHIMIDTNHLVVPDEDDPAGFMRRIIYVPFGPEIKESDMDKDLELKLAKIKQSVFLNILLRFSAMEPSKLSTPDFSKELVKTVELFNNPIDFFYKKWCIPAIDLHGGKNYKLSEIYRIFMQEFFYDYENSFSNVFYHSEDFHKRPATIQKCKFNLKMQDLHHYVTNGHAGELVFHNLIIHNPGNYLSMRDYQRIQLKTFYRVCFSDDEADAIISDAERPPVISVPQSIFDTEYRDILWFKGFPSFEALGIPPDKVMWENTILMRLINGNAMLISTWLQNSMDSDKYAEIWSRLSGGIQKNSCNYFLCSNDSNIRGILNSLFDFYVNSVRRAAEKMSHMGKLKSTMQKTRLSLLQNTAL